jgi:hypothetical protein
MLHGQTPLPVLYAEAYDELCRGDDVPEHRSLQCFGIAAWITYLDTFPSLSAEVRFFDGRNHGWENGFWEQLSLPSG